MEAQTLQDKLEASLRMVLDQVDYTAGACRLTEMVGAALPSEVIKKARQALCLASEARAAALRK